MIIERLKLKNFGVFRGEHSVDLKPSGASKPIILVGALNGAGKTTLIEALQLVLYGKRSSYGWRGATAYPQYITEVRNRHAALTESTAIEITLSLTSGRHLRLRREWVYTKQTPKEYVTVYANESETPDDELSSAWDDEVEKLLPARLAELFFFDGEKIERLAEPTKSAEVLQTAISALLGLDLIDHLINDLELTRYRQKQAAISADDEDKRQLLDTRYREIAQAREDSIQAKARLVTERDSKQKELRVNEDTLHKLGGERYNQREKLVAERATLLARVDEGYRQLRSLSASSFPLLIAAELLAPMAARGTANTRSIDPSAAAAVVTVLEGLDKWASTEDLGDNVRKSIRARIKDEIQKARAQIDQCRPGSAAIDYSRISALLSEELPALRSSAQTELAIIEKSLERIHALDEAIAQIPEFDQLAALLQQQGAIRAEIDSIESAIAARETTEELFKRQLQSLASERDALISRVIESGDAARVAEYCARSIETLRAFREQLIDMRRHQLESLIFESFNKLIRKNDLIRSFSIDPKTMTLQLTAHSGEPMTPQQLSAGERQLIATATLWALAKATGRAVPIVIDTPLGRLDGTHRGTIVERYFPDAGQQVILLSTDQEVHAKYSEVLNRFVTRRYLLQYDAANRSSRISEGYFQGAA